MQENIIHTQTDETGLVLIVAGDPEPVNPREEFDTLCTLACWHRRYRLGDPHGWATPECFDEEMEYRPHLRLPLFLHDHSGITVSTTPFFCPWDSGQVGWVFIERKDMAVLYDRRRPDVSVEDRAKAAMQAEVAEYDQFITGDVWCVRIEDPDGTVLDSCCGFFGLDHAVTEGQRMLDACVDQFRRKRAADLIGRIEAERPDLTPGWTGGDDRA